MRVRTTSLALIPHPPNMTAGDLRGCRHGGPHFFWNATDMARDEELVRNYLLDFDNRALRVTTVLALECSLFPTRLVGFNESERHHRSSAFGAWHSDDWTR
jgi:hypothetical protein